ncbi:MAG: hypothetical protein LBH68_00880 [Bifidobacteriaceae bacterium]|jgi:hypothetical protein|nr:hypothetical protein [Bifidobacteriaceae bacterium]
MSGPKSYAYYVVHQAEMLARRIREAEARCGKLESTLSSLIAELASYGVDGSDLEVPRLGMAIATDMLNAQIGDGAARGEEAIDLIRARQTELRKAIAKAEGRCRQAGAAATLKAMRTATAVGDLESINLGGPPIPAEAKDSAEPGAEDRRQAVERALAAIAELSDPQTRHRLAEQARAVLAADQAQTAEARYAELVMAVGDASKVEAQTQRWRQAAEEAVLTIAHIESAEAEALRAGAAGTRTRQQLESLTGQVEQLLEAERKRQDAEFVAAQATAALEAMGYEVDAPAGADSMSTLLAYREDLPQHALRLQVDPRRGEVATAVVAWGPTTAGQDAAAEEATCEDLAELTHELAERGVRAERRSHVPAGVVAVERDDSARRTRTARPARAAAPEMARKLPKHR